MNYQYRSHKIVAILEKGLETWKCFNVLGHLAIGLGTKVGNSIIGRPILSDASGVAHCGISRFPLIVKQGTQADMRKLLRDARISAKIFVHDYPHEMLATGHDDALQEALMLTREEDIRYLGVVVYGKTNVVDALVGRLPLWSQQVQ